jgi:hypothetical protein
MTDLHDHAHETVAIEVAPQSYHDIALALRLKGHSHLIGEDGVIRMGTVRLRRARPPMLDSLGSGIPGDGLE